MHIAYGLLFRFNWASEIRKISECIPRLPVQLLQSNEFEQFNWNLIRYWYFGLWASYSLIYDTNFLYEKFEWIFICWKVNTIECWIIVQCHCTRYSRVLNSNWLKSTEWMSTIYCYKFYVQFFFIIIPMPGAKATICTLYKMWTYRLLMRMDVVVQLYIVYARYRNGEIATQIVKKNIFFF